MSRLKVVQIPYCFYPDTVGGTEVYVKALTTHLQNRGTSIIVAAPGAHNCTYTHQGIPVRRYGLSKSLPKLEELYGEGDSVAAYNFGMLLDEEHPDIIHMHALTCGVSMGIVREAKSRGIPVVFTYHSPTVSCQRGTLLRWGSEICSGVLNLDTCTKCTLQGLGLPRKFADLVGQTPTFIGRMFGDLTLSGGIWTALRMRALMDARHNTFFEIMNKLDYVISVCSWGRELLINNNINREKILLCRHGINNSGIHKHDNFSELTRNSSEASDIQSHIGDLRIAFLGRLTYVKGAHIVLEALSRVPNLPVKFDLYGVIQDDEDSSYLKRIKSIASRDSRIDLRPQVPNDHVIQLLQTYDLLVVPSQWMETGPMVILEAFAAGIPVIGSKLGGIAENVEHEENGLLVKHDSIEEWSDVLGRLSKDKALLERLKNGVRPPRSMDDVAEDMTYVYNSICHVKNLRNEDSVKA